MSALYIVASPIGNLEDVSKRALRILSEVDLILCEDTRVTKKLLAHYNIKTSMLSYHQHSKLKKVEEILNLLKQGKNLALVSDAGAPGISDPGGKLIEEVFSRISSTKIVPIPGPSAIITAASASGFSMDKFTFLGFPPSKKKRRKFFKEVIDSKYPTIFYESPYRILKSLKELSSFEEKELSSLRVVVCRELTKKFETIYRGTVAQVLKQLKREEIKGEFVVIVKRK